MTNSTPLSDVSIALRAERERRRRVRVERLRDQTGLSLYSPHAPYPKQQQFLELDCREAFFGGAAGGGKSDCLLMCALQFVHVPAYSALILRKDTQRLRLSGGLIPRSLEWLKTHREVHWNGNDSRFTFPSGATLQFGYLDSASDKFRYGSSEFQFIGFDELTEFREDDYNFMFSRLRKTVDLDVPLRVRSASNPGNAGHVWVKSKFISEEAEKALKEGGDGVFYKDGAAFIPSKISDNPAIDEEEYRKSLSHLPPVTRERLMHGDWSIREDSLIREHYLRYYRVKGEFLELLDKDNNVFVRVDQRQCQRSSTCDPAGTSEDIAKQKKNAAHSHTVIQTWDRTPSSVGKYLALRHQWRKRVGFNDLCQGLRDTHKEFRPQRIHIENEKLGVAAVDVLRHEIPIQTIATGGKDKVSRAGPFLSKLERGEIFLPLYNNDWKPDLESEWLAWTGDKDEPADSIDAAAYEVLATESACGSWGGVLNLN